MVTTTETPIELLSLEMYLFQLTPFLDGDSGLVNVIDTWIAELDSR